MGKLTVAYFIRLFSEVNDLIHMKCFEIYLAHGKSYIVININNSNNDLDSHLQLSACNVNVHFLCSLNQNLFLEIGQILFSFRA